MAKVLFQSYKVFHKDIGDQLSLVAFFPNAMYQYLILKSHLTDGDHRSQLKLITTIHCNKSSSSSSLLSSFIIIIIITVVIISQIIIQIILIMLIGQRWWVDILGDQLVDKSMAVSFFTISHRHHHHD